MNNGRTTFLVIGSGDPHILESGEWAENLSSDPRQEPALCMRYDVDFRGCGSEGSDFRG